MELDNFCNCTQIAHCVIFALFPKKARELMMKPLAKWIALLVLTALGLIGCGALATDPALIPTLTAAARATALCIASTSNAKQIVLIWEIYGTPTTTPTRPNEIAPTPTLTITPTGFVDTPGDPARGETLFNGAAQCSSCHDISADIRIVGPSLKGIARGAGTL